MNILLLRRASEKIKSTVTANVRRQFGVSESENANMQHTLGDTHRPDIDPHLGWWFHCGAVSGIFAAATMINQKFHDNPSHARLVKSKISRYAYAVKYID